MTHVHSTATRPGTASGGDPSRAPVSTRVVVDAAGGDGPAAGALSDALTALGLAPEAPDTEAPDTEAPDTGRADSGDPAPAAYCALLLGEEAYGAGRSKGLDRARVRAAALAMAAAGRGRLVLVTDATGETHAGTDPDRYARLAADRAWWQHLVTEVAGHGVTGNTVVTGYSPAWATGCPPGPRPGCCATSCSAGPPRPPMWRPPSPSWSPRGVRTWSVRPCRSTGARASARSRPCPPARRRRLPRRAAVPRGSSRRRSR